MQTQPGTGAEPSCEVLGELSHLGQGAVHPGGHQGLVTSRPLGHATPKEHHRALGPCRKHPTCWQPVRNNSRRCPHCAGRVGASDLEPGSSCTAALRAAGRPWAFSLRARPPHPQGTATGLQFACLAPPETHLKLLCGRPPGRPQQMPAPDQGWGRGEAKYGAGALWGHPQGQPQPQGHLPTRTHLEAWIHSSYSSNVISGSGSSRR